MINYTIVAAITGEGVSRKIYDQFSDTIPKPLRTMKQYQLKSARLDFPVLDESPVLQQVIDILKENEINYDLYHNVYYTAKELNEVPYYKTIIKYPLEIEGVSTNYYGTKYINACPVCGYRGQLIGDVLIDRKLMKGGDFCFLDPEYVVSERVKTIIEENRLSGVQFVAEAKDYKGREMPKYYVIELNELPSMSETVWLVPQKPMSCGHRIVYLRSELRYEREKLEAAKDFNVIAEHVDNWHIQDLVLSKKAKEILSANKVFARYVPVHIL